MDLLILSVHTATYGKAEFQPGMEEVDDTPANPTTEEIPAATIHDLPVVGKPPVLDHTAQEGYTLLQKGLFLAAILGCVAIYVRVSGKKVEKSQGRYREKSMV